MDSHLSVPPQANRHQESRQNNSDSSATTYPKPRRVATLSKQRALKPPPQPQAPPSTRAPTQHRRKLCRREHGDFIMLISTSIQGRLLVSPWPDDPAEDPVTGVPKSDHYMTLSRTEMAAKSSRNSFALSHHSPTAATGQLSVKDRISPIGSSTALKPIDAKPTRHVSTVRDTNTQDKYRHQTAEAMSLDVSYQNSSSHPMSQVSSTESPSKRKERTHGNTKRKADTTATGTRSGGSYSMESVVRDESGERGGNDEDKLVSSIDSVDQFNLETYQPPMKKPRRTAGQILAEIAGDLEAEVVLSSMPSVASSAALAAGIEDIEGFLEKDLQGFTRLSY